MMGYFLTALWVVMIWGVLLVALGVGLHAWTGWGTRRNYRITCAESTEDSLLALRRGLLGLSAPEQRRLLTTFRRMLSERLSPSVPMNGTSIISTPTTSGTSSTVGLRLGNTTLYHDPKWG